MKICYKCHPPMSTEKANEIRWSYPTLECAWPPDTDGTHEGEIKGSYRDFDMASIIYQWKDNKWWIIDGDGIYEEILTKCSCKEEI